MNGFQLYKEYVARGERANRGTSDWNYGQVLTSAFYLVGITRLFDMLEQAEVLGCRIRLVYSLPVDSGVPTPCGIEMIATEQESVPTSVDYRSDLARWSNFMVY